MTSTSPSHIYVGRSLRCTVSEDNIMGAFCPFICLWRLSA